MHLYRCLFVSLLIVPLVSVRFFGFRRGRISGIKEMSESARSALKKELDACRSDLNKLTRTFARCTRASFLLKNRVCQQKAQLMHTRTKCHILEGVYLVDTTVHKGDESTSSSRKKRTVANIERRLGVLAISLENMAEEGGADKRPSPQDHYKRKRGTCYITPRSDHSTRAIRMGKTIETSVSGSVGVVITETRSSGYVYGQNGEFGCLETQCSGLETDAGVAFGVAEGYYYNFDDVAGQSKLYVGSVGGQSLGYTFGFIKSLTTGEKIGYVSSYETAADYSPVSIGVFYCDTEVTRGKSCTVKTTYRTFASRSSWSGRFTYRRIPVKVGVCD